MSIYGSWITEVWDINATDVGEFSGYDADKYSGLIDLGREYDLVQVMIPTIVSSTITVYGVPEDGTAPKTNVPLPIYALDSDATGSFLQATTAAVTTCIVTFPCYGFRYIRLYSATNQTSDVTFYLRGIKL